MYWKVNSFCTLCPAADPHMISCSRPRAAGPGAVLGHIANGAGRIMPQGEGERRGGAELVA